MCRAGHSANSFANSAIARLELRFKSAVSLLAKFALRFKIFFASCAICVAF